jgi:hypothetical protein
MVRFFYMYLFLTGDGPTLLSLLIFVYYSVIYHCFPSTTYTYRSIPLLRPLVCFHSILPIHFLQSIPSTSSLCMSIDSSLFSFIVSSTPLLVVFISLLYTVIILHLFIRLFVRFFPYILLFLPFLVSFL